MRSFLVAAASVLALAACSQETPAPPTVEDTPPAPEEVSITSLTAPIMLTTETGAGAPVGEVTITEGANGAEFAVNLHDLPAGEHGFHVHAEGSCAPVTADDGTITPAGAAGGHWDPDNAGHHGAPDGDGHLGDLPKLTIDANGASTEVVVAPRIHDLAALQGHALMIHAGGDNYSDDPAPLGGGGARLACGVIG